MFYFAPDHCPNALNIFQRANKRAALCRQRERDDDHLASVSAMITEIFSAELPAETSPFTSFTPGRGERALLNSAALFAGISTSTWSSPLFGTPLVAAPRNFFAAVSIPSATASLWPRSVVIRNSLTPSGGGVRVAAAAFSRDCRRCSRACSSSSCRLGLLLSSRVM